MANPTNPFNWQMPTSTDLVTDLPADFETFGQAVATSMADLLGGTTGQVLSKASNTDMDFTWVTSDDANAIQNTIVDAKGDLIGATAADTPARLAVGTNGQVLTADSTAATGLAWTTVSGAESLGFTAGKNKIINGDFNINQRSFSSTTTSATYGFDRWRIANSGGTVTYSAQTFTLGTAPVSGYEGKNFARVVTASQSAAGDFAVFSQFIESVRTFAGQTVTVSFWAKAAAGTPKVAVEFVQAFGTGGSPSADVNTYAGQITLSTSWARYSVSVAVPSISGKTIGTASNDSLGLFLWTSAGSTLNSRTGSLGAQNATIDFWGVQVEAGSTVTAFQTATGTIQGELDACRRYLPAIGVNAAGTSLGGYEAMGYTYSTNNNVYTIAFDVEARVAPTGITIPALSNFILYNASNSSSTPSAVTFNYGGINAGMILATGTSTANQPSRIGINGYILFTGCEL
jgi:hypothetical protein